MLVEIWSDVVCPWCYLGKRRFDRALAEFEHADEVDVLFRAFELDPAAPAERAEVLTEHLAAKYGVDLGQAEAMQQRVTQLAAEEGLTYRFDLARTARTFDAHRVLHLARRSGRQPETVERLMAAYFTEGARIAEPETLLRLAIEAGLDEPRVRAVLTGDAFTEEVRDDEQTAASFGISGVPFFVVDRRLGVSGAQPVEVMGELLRQGWAQRAP